MKIAFEILRKFANKEKQNPEDTFYNQKDALEAMELYAAEFAKSKNDQIKELKEELRRWESGEISIEN